MFDPTRLRQHHNSWSTARSTSKKPEDIPRAPDPGPRRVTALLHPGVPAHVLVARRIYGPTAGLIALVFTAFSPNLLAHGSLVTTDIYLTAAVVGFLLCCDRFLCGLRDGRC